MSAGSNALPRLRTLCLFSFARSILHLKRRAFLWPALPTIIESCRSKVGMPEPLLHFGNIGVVC